MKRFVRSSIIKKAEDNFKKAPQIQLDDEDIINVFPFVENAVDLAVALSKDSDNSELTQICKEIDSNYEELAHIGDYLSNAKNIKYNDDLVLKLSESGKYSWYNGVIYDIDKKIDRIKSELNKYNGSIDNIIDDVYFTNPDVAEKLQYNKQILNRFINILEKSIK